MSQVHRPGIALWPPLGALKFETDDQTLTLAVLPMVASDAELEAMLQAQAVRARSTKALSDHYERVAQQSQLMTMPSVLPLFSRDGSIVSANSMDPRPAQPPQTAFTGLKRIVRPDLFGSQPAPPPETDATIHLPFDTERYKASVRAMLAFMDNQPDVAATHPPISTSLPSLPAPTPDQNIPAITLQPAVAEPDVQVTSAATVAPIVHETPAPSATTILQDIVPVYLTMEQINALQELSNVQPNEDALPRKKRNHLNEMLNILNHPDSQWTEISWDQSGKTWFLHSLLTRLGAELAKRFDVVIECGDQNTENVLHQLLRTSFQHFGLQRLHEVLPSMDVVSGVIVRIPNGPASVKPLSDSIDLYIAMDARIPLGADRFKCASSPGAPVPRLRLLTTDSMEERFFTHVLGNGTLAAGQATATEKGAFTAICDNARELAAARQNVADFQERTNASVTNVFHWIQGGMKLAYDHSAPTQDTSSPMDVDIDIANVADDTMLVDSALLPARQLSNTSSEGDQDDNAWRALLRSLFTCHIMPALERQSKRLERGPDVSSDADSFYSAHSDSESTVKRVSVEDDVLNIIECLPLSLRGDDQQIMSVVKAKRAEFDKKLLVEYQELLRQFRAKVDSHQEQFIAATTSALEEM
ncbi:hypothetical protein BC940DRAFT_287003 [Gongronella butleri]|nr:hypothetical protein BC940DRAFT_287003 [Gongronella butleri]